MSNIVVTGGSRGLGLAVARRLAQGGHAVIAVARSPGELSGNGNGATHGGGSLHFHQGDLMDISAIPAMVTGISGKYGGIFGLVNCAGIGTSGLLAMMPEQKIDALIRLNVSAAVMMSKHAVRAMMVGGGGRVVSLSSVAASTGFSGLSVYAATKAALVGFSRSLAREVGPAGITVNCVAPGIVDTDMTAHMSAQERARVLRRSPLGILPQAEDVAGAVAYLMGESGRHVTGMTLTVDSGYSA
jgi:3-oxoacyl-[acyl-carrier protein] reductase